MVALSGARGRGGGGGPADGGGDGHDQTPSCGVWCGRERMGRRWSQSQMPCTRIRAEIRWGMRGCRMSRRRQGRARRRFRPAPEGRAERHGIVASQRHGRGDKVRRQGEPQFVAAGDVEERGDIEALVRHGGPGLVWPQEVSVPLAVGVVDLCDDAHEDPVAVIAPEDRERVEHVAQDPGVGQHENSAPVTEADAAQRQVVLDVALDRQARVAEVVSAAEVRERPQVPRLAGEAVQVDQPLVDPVPEGVPDRSGAPVRDLADD